MKWTKKFPDKPGKYWFYGQRYGTYSGCLEKKVEKPELMLVSVRKCASGFLCVAEGQFFYKSELGEIKYFKKATMPELPDVSEQLAEIEARIGDEPKNGR